MLKLNYRTLFLIFPLVLPICISSCSTFDPPEMVPAYGHIDSIHFTMPADSVALMGSPSANIPYAWVYLDDNPVGAFQMPCTFPMIAANGSHNIKIYPGVTPVGINSPAAIYPFYQFYSFNINLQQGSTYKFHPTSLYYTWAKFPFLENFESGGEIAGQPSIRIINYHGGGSATGASTTSMYVIQNPNLVYGRSGNSGMVVVNQSTPYYCGVTFFGKDSLPNSNTPVYIELNYRCTADFSIGLFESNIGGDTASQASPTAIVYPASKWTKMYVCLNTTLQQFSSTSYNHQLYFTMQWQQGDPNDTLLLDNIKILY